MYLKKYKNLLYILFISQVSCDNEYSNVSDFSGTWVVESTTTYFDKNTSLFHSEGTFYSTVYIMNTASNTEYLFKPCNVLIDPASLTSDLSAAMSKAGDTLDFVDSLQPDFTIINSKTLTRSFQYISIDFIENTTQKATKLSSNFEFDRAYLEINGPISVKSSELVCFSQSKNSTQDGFDYKIRIPFDNKNIEYVIRSSFPLVEGKYQYQSSPNPLPMYLRLDVNSSTDLFYNNFGTSSLEPNTVELNITTSNGTYIEGNFSFIGIDGGMYNGVFDFTQY